MDRMSWSNGSLRSSPTPSTATTLSDTISIAPSTATSSSVSRSMPPPAAYPIRFRGSSLLSDT